MQLRMVFAFFRVGLIFAAISCPGITVSQSLWPQFRGPDANPIAENDRLPDRWSKTENVEWSTEIPGRGWSSPIVAGDKVFLTTVTTDGKSKEPQVGIDYSNEFMEELERQGYSPEEVLKRLTERDYELPVEVSVHYFLYCLSLDSGDVLWKDEFFTGKPPGGRHRKNSYSSETPVTDGKLVYVYVANIGLFAYDLEGQQVWHKKLDAYPIYLDFGSGSSPVLHKGRLILVHDNEEFQFIAAFDKTNGEMIWQTERKFPNNGGEYPRKSGWSTPYIWRNQLRTEIFTLGPGIAISYDLDGNELWRIGGMTIVPSASCFAQGDLLLVNAGKKMPIFAITAGADGDITPKDDDQVSEFIKWQQPRSGSFVPTPVAYRGGLYVLSDNGIFSRFDTRTGERSFKSRIRAFNVGGANFTSSPWAYNGKVFCLSEQGETYVFAAGEEHELLYVNSLGDMALASPAIVGDRLLIRTDKRLYSIRKKKQ